MTLKRKIQAGLLAIALLAVAAAGSLFWFNWWLRFGTTRIYPLCFDGDGYTEFTEPLTPQANAVFIKIMSSHTKGYVWIKDGQVIAMNWYWLFGEGALAQRTYSLLRELALSHGLDPEMNGFCSDLALMGTPARSSDYSGIAYPSNFTRDTLEPLSFGARAERAGYYTPVGRFYQWLGQLTGDQEK
ncbi:MAG: hypothetical protein HQL43_07075 [Alphaproteobacteria bacterium]|nr:hypothetical protein [Alphaproteobacteria bacterium]